MHGWVPAIGWRTRRWRTRWLPLALLVVAAAAGGVAASRRRDVRSAAVSAVRGAGTEPVGGLLPHPADGVGPVDGRAAARRDQAGRRDRYAAEAHDPRHRHRRAGGHRRRRIPLQTSDGTRLPATCWCASNPPPRLPTVMMIGGEF